MTAQELEKLLAEVTPGEWFVEWNGPSIMADDEGDPWEICKISVDCGIPDDKSPSNARLIAMAPTLARRVIAAEKLAEALRWVSDRPYAHQSNKQSVLDAALAAWEAAQ